MNLLRAATTVGSYTAISRIFGLIREIFLSHILGAGIIADAFVVAFKFPNFFRRFFAEGAFNAAFVPQFAGLLTGKDSQQSYFLAKELAQKVFSNLAWFLFIFVVFVELTTPYLIPLLAPGFATTPEQLNLAIQFTRITFPYILFISLSALLAGVLNSLHHFAAAAAAPILLNLMMISALVFYPQTGMEPAFVLCWSVFLAGLIQFAWLYWACQKLDFKFWLTWPQLTADVKKVLKLTVPGTIGAGVMQINLFIDMMLASLLPAGSLSYLYYADRLNHLPLSIFGVAIGTALLPMLSKAWRQGNQEQAYHSQNIALDFALQLTIPAAVGLMVLSYPLIDLIFGHGHFQKADVWATAPALAAFAFGLPAYVTGKVFATTYFACEDTSTPVKVAILCVITNFGLNLLFMPFFKHVGMALATSLAAWLNTIVLAVILKRRRLFYFSRSLLNKVFRVNLVSMLMGIILICVQYQWPLENISTYYKIIKTLSLVGLGGAFYLIFGYKAGIRPLKHFSS
jgi:putative peptidoglycan lipid II flippase